MRYSSKLQSRRVSARLLKLDEQYAGLGGARVYRAVVLSLGEHRLAGGELGLEALAIGEGELELPPVIA